MIAQAVGIGMILSFIFSEIAGLSAGGLIVPGYLAFFSGQPFRIVATFIVAVTAYAFVKVLSNFIILYGRRRFMATILIAYLIGWVISISITRLVSVEEDIRIIGYIIPGLIANDMFKQGIWKTVAATLLVATAVKLILVLLMRF